MNHPPVDRLYDSSSYQSDLYANALQWQIPNYFLMKRAIVISVKLGVDVNEQTSSFFNTYLSFISNVLQDILKFNLGNLDFFFSTKGQRGESHVDREHVLILGVYKNTYYHVDGKDIKVCPGDILYIYKNNL